MRAAHITAALTFFGLAFPDNGVENRKLFLDFRAAAIRAISFTAAVRRFFKDFKFFTAFFTNIFKNRHIFFP
jgi:hypothetical protein